MTDEEFDRALVSAAFTLAADRGWGEVSVIRAARAGELPLERARARFLGRPQILGRFGRIADQAALSLATTDGTVRDRLFDVLMRRFDVLQAHRGGVLALKSFLPLQPMLVLSLGAAHLLSIAFMLEAAGIRASGPRGSLRTQGLVAVWLRTARAWESDDSDDLSGTMAALDAALDRAASVERWLRWEAIESATPAVEPSFDPPGGEFPDAEPFATDAAPVETFLDNEIVADVEAAKRMTPAPYRAERNLPAASVPTPEAPPQPSPEPPPQIPPEAADTTVPLPPV